MPHLSQSTMNWLLAGGFLLFFLGILAPSWKSKPKEEGGVWIFPVKPTRILMNFAGIAVGIALIASSHYLIGTVVLAAAAVAWPVPVRADQTGISAGTVFFRSSMKWDAMKEICNFTDTDQDGLRDGDGILINSHDDKQLVISRQSYDTKDIAKLITSRVHIPYVLRDQQIGAKSTIYGKYRGDK